MSIDACLTVRVQVAAAQTGNTEAKVSALTDKEQLLKNNMTNDQVRTAFQTCVYSCVYGIWRLVLYSIGTWLFFGLSLVCRCWRLLWSI